LSGNFFFQLLCPITSLATVEWVVSISILGGVKSDVWFGYVLMQTIVTDDRGVCLSFRLSVKI